MILNARVYDTQLQTYVSAKRGEQSQMVYMLQDISPTPTAQYFEFSPQGGTAKLTKDQIVNIHVTEIRSVFNGRPRISGNVVEPAKQQK